MLHNLPASARYLLEIRTLLQKGNCLFLQIKVFVIHIGGFFLFPEYIQQRLQGLIINLHHPGGGKKAEQKTGKNTGQKNISHPAG